MLTTEEKKNILSGCRDSFEACVNYINLLIYNEFLLLQVNVIVKAIHNYKIFQPDNMLQHFTP